MSVFRNINNTSLTQEVNLTGKYKGKDAKVIDVLFRREVFTTNTAFNDCTMINTTLPLFPTVTTSETLEIVSTNVNDTLLGTGARIVEITYINAANDLVITQVNLNGTTVVPLTGITANEIISMEAISVGSNNVSVGDVILRKVVGGVQLEIIKTGGNKSTSGKFMIPQGYDGYMLNMSVDAIAQSMDYRLRATVKSFDRTLISNYLFQNVKFLASGQASDDIDLEFKKLPELTKIKMSVIVGAVTGNPRAEGHFSILIIKK